MCLQSFSESDAFLCIVMPYSVLNAIQNHHKRSLWSLLVVLSGYSEVAKMFDFFIIIIIFSYISQKIQTFVLETIIFVAGWAIESCWWFLLIFE